MAPGITWAAEEYASDIVGAQRDNSRVNLISTVHCPRHKACTTCTQKFGYAFDREQASMVYLAAIGILRSVGLRVVC